LVRLVKTSLDETQSKVIKGNHLSSSFPIDNGLEQGDALSPLLINFALKYAIGKVQETNLGLDMNSINQILAYAGDVNLIFNHIKTIARNADMLLNACKDVDLALNTGKTKYMEVRHHQGIMANEHIKIGSSLYEKSENI
jgi:Reverse transcriptase (RNA-dependent DNA polymerase).